ncbi:MAG: OsmC family protein [Candidatus Omnitrophota bacterium]|nr:OsmC family protein [Candidatus Omnitrophota bacterium]
MYRVNVTNAGDYSFKVKAREYEFLADMEGKRGITPPDTLLAGLGTCVGVYLRKYAEGAKLSLPEFSVSVEAEFSKEAPVCFRKINVNVDLKGAKIDERRLPAILEFIKNCPVHNTLKNSPEVEFKLDWKASEI